MTHFFEILNWKTNMNHYDTKDDVNIDVKNKESDELKSIIHIKEFSSP